MKFKLYLRMVLATITALFVATGCNKTDSEVVDPVDPVEDLITFDIKVASVTPGEAIVDVKPSKSTVLYYCDAITKAEFDKYNTGEDFLVADLKRLEGLAAQEKMTLKVYLEMYGNRGTKSITVKTPESKTDYYAYVYALKTDGTILSKVATDAFVSAEKPLVPVIDVTMWPGNAKGEYKSIMVSFALAVKESPAVAVKYYFNETAAIEAAIAGGETYQSLAEKSDKSFEGELIAEINSAEGLTGYGFGSPDSPLPSGLSVTFIVMAIDANGAVAVEHVEAKTEPSGDGPALDLQVAAGDKDGLDKDTKMLVGVTSASKNVTSCKYLLGPTAEIEKLIGQGATYDQILDANGEDVPVGQYIDAINGKGLSITFSKLTPGTSYTAIVKVGNGSAFTMKHQAASTTGGGGGGDLTFSFSVTEITATAAKIRVIPSNNTDTYYFDVLESSEIAGATDAQIVAGCGDLPSEYPSQGVDGYDPAVFEKYPLTTDVEYTVFAFGYANGAATTPVAKYTFTPTGGGGDASDAYKAWLGTWTVKSTKNEVDNTPVSFDVTFSQKVANSSYKVVGWGINGNRLLDDVAMTFDFDSATGGFKAMNSFVIISGYKAPDGSTGTIQQLMIYLDPDEGKYYSVSGKIPALIATMNANKQSANVVGGTFNFEGDPNTYTASCLDLAIVSGNSVWRWNPAEGYTNRPVGPYTMTKKSGASAPAKSMGVKTIGVVSTNKANLSKSVAVASNIPQFSSILKASSMPKGASMLKAPMSLEVDFQTAAVATSPIEAAFEAVRVE